MNKIDYNDALIKAKRLLDAGMLDNKQLSELLYMLTERVYTVTGNIDMDMGE